jgi:hypothetical protein
MKNYKINVFLWVFLVCLYQSPDVLAQFRIDLESGVFWNGYNDVAVPRDEGTEFSLTENAKPDRSTFYRIQLMYTLNKRHTFRALYAPLKVNSKGTFDREVFFAGSTFSPNSVFSGIYKFNSYRLTYRYLFSNSGKFHWGLGLTGKIRDAKIEIIADNIRSVKTDLGFVPLINFLLEWYPGETFSLQLTGDALAVPGSPGRAEDVLLAFRYHLEPDLVLKAGYRILEGGADVAEVYNFTFFHYALLGITVGF